MTTITDIITYLQNHLDETDITLNPGASPELIKQVEAAYAVTLPDDVKQFYEFTDGFFSEEDQFSIIPLDDLIRSKTHGEKKIHIAEYMIYCDMWELVIDKKDHNKYQLCGGSRDGMLNLTNSFAEFLRRFLKGGVFEKGGLYDWRDEIIYNRFISSPKIVVAKFKVEHTLRLHLRGMVLFGEIIDGKIVPDNIIEITLDKKTLVSIKSIEGVRTSNMDTVGLLMDQYNPNFDNEFKKLTGNVIYIYAFATAT